MRRMRRFCLRCGHEHDNWLLDLYCGAGGAGEGYHRAGFGVIGVDMIPQPRYRFEFHRADVFVYPLEWWGEFDAIHASPPCQAYSAMRHLPWLRGKPYPRLIEPTRAMLERIGLPYVIENVERAPLSSSPPSLFSPRNGIILCGRQFGLPLYRHRKFESNVPLRWPAHHPKHEQIIYGSRWLNKRYSGTGGVIGVVGHTAGVTHAMAQEAMGIDWMRREELTQAIPPAMTEFIGRQLLDQLAVKS
jgi:DNA (cytosine-5)-methyltransferase 1